MTVLYQVCGKFGLFLYMVLLVKVWYLCKYGGSWGDVYGLVPIGAGVILCIVLRLISGFLKEDEEKEETDEYQESKKKIRRMKILFIAIGTLCFCVNVIYTAIPYNGALSWQLEEWFGKKEAKLEHDNFFEDHVSGILADLGGAVELPEELYIGERFQVEFDERGKIGTINTFLYGMDEKGKTRTYLVSYDADMGDTMTVRTGLEGNVTYADDMRLAPMLAILQAADDEEQLKAWCAAHRQHRVSNPDEAGEDEDTRYEILYFGRRSFSTEEGLKYLPGDADGDGEESGLQGFGQLKNGGEIRGFEVSLHIPEREEIIPVRYIMEPEYITQAQLNGEQEMRQAEAAVEAEKWITDPSDGSVYFFLDENKGWRLVVVNAAAGSRAYGLEKTEDGGGQWNRVDGSPFEGATGAAHGLIFFDEEIGFAGLAGASGSHAQLYVTKDGGNHFTEVRLPVDSVAELPEHALEYGNAAKDYDYPYLPEKDKDALTVLAVTQAGETEGILFRSEDGGENWEYAGVTAD